MSRNVVSVERDGTSAHSQISCSGTSVRQSPVRACVRWRGGDCDCAARRRTARRLGLAAATAQPHESTRLRKGRQPRRTRVATSLPSRPVDPRRVGLRAAAVSDGPKRREQRTSTQRVAPENAARPHDLASCDDAQVSNAELDREALVGLSSARVVGVGWALWAASGLSGDAAAAGTNRWGVDRRADRDECPGAPLRRGSTPVDTGRRVGIDVPLRELPGVGGGRAGRGGRSLVSPGTASTSRRGPRAGHRRALHRLRTTLRGDVSLARRRVHRRVHRRCHPRRDRGHRARTRQAVKVSSGLIAVANLYTAGAWACGHLLHLIRRRRPGEGSPPTPSQIRWGSLRGAVSG